MKTKLMSLILIVAIATIASFSWQSGEVMAVEFPANGAGEQVNFGATASTVAHKLIIYWAYASGSHVTNSFNPVQRFTTNDGWKAYIGGTSRRTYFRQEGSADQGLWYPATLFGLSAYHMVAIEYDNSNVANDPNFWYDGAVNGSVTEVTAPSDIVNTGAEDLVIGANAGETEAGVFRVPMVLIYDVSSWSAAEITQVVTDAYNSRLAIPTYRNLVFAPALYGITGASDGDTMGVTDFMFDQLSGAKGTPAGSPVFRADDLLTIGD